MTIPFADIAAYLGGLHPYDGLTEGERNAFAAAIEVIDLNPGDSVYRHGQPLDGLYIVYSGVVEVVDANDIPVSILGPRNSFGERGLLREGVAVTSATATEPTVLLMLPKMQFAELVHDHQVARKFFDRSRTTTTRGSDLATSRVESFMHHSAFFCMPGTTVQDAAREMRDRHVSCLCVLEDDALVGIVTNRDLTDKALADGMPVSTPVVDVMTKNPITLEPSAIGSDVLHAMMERRIGHIPITQNGVLVGIVTQTDLTRFQAVSSAELVAEIAHAPDAEAMAVVTARIPKLLVQLVAAGNRHEVVTRLITDVADTATRRLLALAEEKLGTPPVPYLWAACGSQGRQEQTGVSDQDNCLIIADGVTHDQMDYFRRLARFVCDGLNTCGYVYCPGDMMATAERWCQPLSVWRGYFDNWMNKPSPEAQMLASVMFDLRPIGGDTSMFKDLQADTLRKAASNSIFVAHMISNSLKHTPPLGLLRGFATIRSGEHKNQIDLKHNGVVPIADLGRVYALQGQLTAFNTRARLEAAAGAGLISASGGKDLLDAYDLIAETRLQHQARLVKAGEAPDNFMSPSSLSDLERSHLRDAFVVVKGMQAALGHGKGALS
ncbi:cyclic nucleotide-binding/CBS domain-containing protein [Donghicola sp. C2-DW-16]|uniref:Cyclic nucleotide-binding/CBS domain-containing protein n=1 Tax=Donghicola mangrovi TaxID=2729614 RepID=A0ABX2PG99_9RHOB|nr:DUF294 nucleotidyltransferase-like domain-containing protein [Donghicola mangrovi]NVO28527.1 cyclic nucleotide-binding/CBS domain-containing protein [Donghicola mangrovi]